MPPKPKFTRDEIIQAAFELTREQGIGSVAARSVAARLNTSVTPIFTAFSSMEELKSAVLHKARNALLHYMDGLFDYSPVFKEFGMRWVRFAQEEPHLYQLLFQQVRSDSKPYTIFMNGFQELLLPVLADTASTFEISPAEAEELFNEMIIHANGIASFHQNGVITLTRQQVSRSLSRICTGLVIGIKLRNGSFSEPVARSMANSAAMGIEPTKTEDRIHADH